MNGRILTPRGTRTDGLLVYGDATNREDPHRKAARIRAGVERLPSIRLQIERHSLLTDLLMEAGELERDSWIAGSRKMARSGRAWCGPRRRV